MKSFYTITSFLSFIVFLFTVLANSPIRYEIAFGFLTIIGLMAAHDTDE